MPSPPTLVSYTEVTSWATGGTTKSTASISWQTGDLLVVVGGNASASTLGTPTATGLVFTKTQDIPGTASVCAAFVATATAGSTSSGAVSVTNSATSTHFGFGVWVWRLSTGFGNSAKQSTSTKTVAVTPAGGADSAFVWGAFDFSANASLGTIVPTPTDQRQLVQDGTQYDIYVADLTDQTSAGATSYGISGSAGVGPWSIVVQEIKAQAGGGAAAGIRTNPITVLGVM